jgi:hypothetical protein
MDTRVVKRTRGAELLEKWLAENDLTLKQVGDQLGKSHVSIIKWKSGEFRPEPIEREKLEKLSMGGVPANAWHTDDEKAALDRLQPLCGAAGVEVSQ